VSSIDDSDTADAGGDEMTSPSTVPGSVSDVTRLADAAQHRVEQCGCDAPTVTVLRGFDASSRLRAREVRARLRGCGIATSVTAAPMVDAHRHRGAAPMLLEARTSAHVCVLVDATAGGLLEVDRIGGWLHRPVVALSSPPTSTTMTSTQVRAVIRAELSVHDEWLTNPAQPSASGRVVGIAFADVVIEPRDPETGRLQLRLADDRLRPLPAGSSISVQMDYGQLRVTTVSPSGEGRCWTTSLARVDQVTGLHAVWRDGLLVADLESSIELLGEPHGVVIDHV
jgi:hypothetical protein